MELLVSLWHAYRVPVLIFVAVAFGIAWLSSFLRKRTSNTTSIASAAVLVNEKTPPLPPNQRTLLSPEKYDTLPSRSSRSAPKRIVGSKPVRTPTEPSTNYTTSAIQPIVFYASLSGSTEKAASDLAYSYLNFSNSSTVNPLLKPQLLDLSYVDHDDYFITSPKNTDKQSTALTRYFYIILIPTYNIDTILTNFINHLEETHYDFRVDTAPLSDLLGYAVFGFGDRQGWPTEEAGFCSQAIEVDKWMAKLTGRKRAYPLGQGDVHAEGLLSLQTWTQGILSVLKDLADGKGLGEGVPGSGDALESDDEEEDVEEAPQPRKKSSKSKPANIDDLESLGASMKKSSPNSRPVILATDFTTSNSKPAANATTVSAPKEMVPKSSPTYNALTKQGYTIVGSHSGVKICRWTKSALRGRGSCYKFSFYGIKSHLCMESTPSLSCSNKCVFCWRHGTNPVGTTWRWQVDPPDLIFDGVKKGHYAKIKMMRGVPGVRAERFEEAMRIRHCALSLVGEPIFYPHINEFTALLHKEHISSFLVCNAQHPDQLEALQRVTQLYVSIDASNRESLRKIDRPLHRDFWERFCRCLDILREKRFQQRTVFRLTLVKGFNIEDEVEGYADLVERGLPCFVEIKGVTYCGTSTSAGAGLTMRNVPFYEEVCEFVHALNASLEKRGLGYGIAAEHAHSCCVLIASTRFLSPAGRWRTVIDYDKFFELLDRGEDFTPEDYTAETAEWALWGNGGFDPADERVKRKGKK